MVFNVNHNVTSRLVSLLLSSDSDVRHEDRVIGGVFNN